MAQLNDETRCYWPDIAEATLVLAHPVDGGPPLWRLFRVADGHLVDPPVAEARTPDRRPDTVTAALLNALRPDSGIEQATVAGIVGNMAITSPHAFDH